MLDNTNSVVAGVSSLLLLLPTADSGEEEVFEARNSNGKLTYIENVSQDDMPDEFDRTPSQYAEGDEEAERPGNMIKIQTRYDGVPVTIKFWDVYGADDLNTEQPYSESAGSQDRLEAVEIEAYRGLVGTTLSVDDRGEPIEFIDDRLSGEQTEQLYDVFSQYYHDIREGANRELRTGEEYEPDFREMIREVQEIT